MSIKALPLASGISFGVLPPIAAAAGISVTRTSTGLVLTDNFNRADGAPGSNYTPNGPLAISGGKMVFSYTSGVTCNLQLNQAVFPDTISRHSQMVFSRADLNAYVGWKPRRIDSTHYFFADSGAASDSNANRPRFDRGIAGVDTLIGLGVAGTAAAVGSKFRLTCSTLASEMKLWIDDNLQVGVTDTNNNSAGSCIATGTPFGGTARGASNIYLISVCSARTITVNGLPTGWMARLAGINSAASTGSAVTIDPLGALLPIEHMDIIDGSGVVQHSARVDAYGGDVFSVTVP